MASKEKLHISDKEARSKKQWQNRDINSQRVNKETWGGGKKKKKEAHKIKCQKNTDCTRDCGVAVYHVYLQGRQLYPLK